jgi:diguanylate cyclase (GGDEF)-like protein/PAS domain S-box-containing protein
MNDARHAHDNGTQGVGTLLVVDDDPMNVDMLARRLERAGFNVERAMSGHEALELIGTAHFDLVLLDHSMPEMTGLEVLESLRKTYSVLELPVIMVTAVNDSNMTADALQLGANDYITKPVDFVVALARIRAQLDRCSAERKVIESNLRGALAARGSNDGLWDWDLDTNEMYFSPRWTEILGYTDAELQNSPDEWFSRIHLDDSNNVQHELEATITGASQQFESEHRLRHRDGTWRWVRGRAKATRDSSGRVHRIAGTLTDITQEKSADPLTNLPNRAAMLEELSGAIAQLQNDFSYSFAVILIDVDRFKVINDGLGHRAGDELLVGISQRLRRAAGQAFVARFGGDEFAMLIDRTADAEEIASLGNAIREEFSQPFRLRGREVFCTLSLGAALGGDASNVEDLLRDADTAMHRAKTQGGGRLEIFHAEMRKRAVARLELELDMHRSVDNHDFEVHYQPKICLSNDRVTGFEALLRWRHPRFGLLYPADFISLAEQTGLIVPLGLWVFEQAARQIARWHEIFRQTPPLAMSVNLSCRQFLDPNLIADIRRILTETGVDPGTLRLELTESVLIDDTDGAVRILENLKDLGLGLKMDDFGTGYSSLNCLSRLPFDSLKIDRSFVSNLDGSGREIVKTVVQLAGTLGMTVVAEGVETRAQLEALQALGCGYAQGYYFCKPARPEEIERTLSKCPEGWRTTPVNDEALLVDTR